MAPEKPASDEIDSTSKNASSARPNRSEEVLKFAPFVLPILGALFIGAWTLFQYFGHEKSQQELANEYQRLTNAQLKALIEQQNKLRSTEERQAKVSLETSEIDNKLRSIQFQKESDTTVQFDSTLELRPVADSPNTYEAFVNFTAKNTSSKPLEISWVRYEWYLGSVATSVGAEVIDRVNSPPRRFTGFADEGPIAWLPVGEKSYRYRTSNLIPAWFSQRFPAFAAGGGGTALLGVNEVSRYSMPLVIKAKPVRWVGVSMMFGVDGGMGGVGRSYFETLFRALPRAGASQAQSR